MTYAGVPVIYSFIICTAVNIAIIPVIFLFLDYINHYLLKLKWYKRLFNKIVVHMQKKFNKHKT